jgi:VWFA-related protein
MNRNLSPKFIWTLSLVVMFLWLASSGCKGRTADLPSAQINVSRQIAYGNVVLSDNADQTISIQNTGSGSLTIGQIAQADPLAPPFSIVNDACSGQTVQPSAACSFNVRFSPTSQGTFTDTFDIPSDASNDNSVTVYVTGSGIADSAQINVSSRQIAYGNVVMNTISDHAISIQNTGSGSLTIGQIAQADPLAPPFSIVSDACSGQTVQPSAECSFNVRFSPTSQSTFADSFDIPSDASNDNSVTVSVTGSGKALRVAINQVITNSCSTGVLELIVNVTDQNNTPVAGLALGDFQLKENGVPQTIESVSQVTTTVPISMAMVLDYTGSVQSLLPTIEAASIVFIEHLNPDDEASIIKFAQLQQQMCGFTSDAAVLTTAINTAPSQIGQDDSDVYDALWFAIDKTAVRLKHKAIVLVSDGNDERSVKTLDDVIAHATENDVAIYTVGLGDVGGVVMNRLASETGGQYYYITNADQLTGVYLSISDILLGQYSVKYISSQHGSSPIMLELNVVDGADEGVGTSQAVGCP